MLALRFKIDDLRPWEWWAWEADEADMMTTLKREFTTEYDAERRALRIDAERTGKHGA